MKVKKEKILKYNMSTFQHFQSVYLGIYYDFSSDADPHQECPSDVAILMQESVQTNTILCSSGE